MCQTDQETIITKAPFKKDEQQSSSFDMNEFAFIEAGSPPNYSPVIVPNAESANPYKRTKRSVPVSDGDQKPARETRLPPLNPQSQPQTARINIRDDYSRK